MAITKSRINVDDSIVSVSHTGDANWQTALSVIGKGEAEIHLGSSTVGQCEIRITIDGNVLYAGMIGGSKGSTEYVFDIDYNKTLLVEYRDNVGDQIAYCDILYYNL